MKLKAELGEQVPPPNIGHWLYFLQIANRDEPDGGVGDVIAFLALELTFLDHPARLYRYFFSGKAFGVVGILQMFRWVENGFKVHAWSPLFKKAISAKLSVISN